MQRVVDMNNSIWLRIKKCQVLIKMNQQSGYAEKIGIKDKSHYDVSNTKK